MWSNIAKNCEKLVRNEKSSAIKWKSIGERKRAPKFGVKGGAGVPLIQFPNQQKRPSEKAGDGNQEPQKKEDFIKAVQPVTMAAGKRIPLIKFPNRRAGETQGSRAVGRATGGGRSQAMPSLPSGTASSQPPRIQLSEAEIEAVLLGAELEPDPKKAALKKK